MLKGRRGIFPGQAQESQTASIGLLGMTAGGQERLHHLSGRTSDPAGPLQEAFRTPAAHGLMGVGHVRGQRGVTAGCGILSMAGHAGAVLEDLHDGVGDADPDLLVDQGVGDGVKMAVHLDVIVDMDFGLLPAGQFVADRRKR